VERIGRFHHDVCRAGDQVMGLQQAVNRGLGHKVLPFISKSHGQLAWAEFGLLQRHLDDLVLHLWCDAVPYPARR
jgi:hypothetical protein